jgi:hypothetical protein
MKLCLKVKINIADVNMRFLDFQSKGKIGFFNVRGETGRGAPLTELNPEKFLLF